MMTNFTRRLSFGILIHGDQQDDNFFRAPVTRRIEVRRYEYSRMAMHREGLMI